MADIPLQEAAQLIGVPYANLKKQGQRGQIRVRTINGRLFISSEDLDAYLAVKAIDELHPVIVGKDISTVAREAGNMITKLPQKVRDAILAGIPTSGKGAKGGSPDAYLEAVEGMPRNKPVPSISDDPHFHAKIGYQHEESPRWKRISKSVWALDGATWTYSPDPKGGEGIWIGGGSREGVTLAAGFSPANPYSDLRPLG